MTGAVNWIKGCALLVRGALKMSVASVMPTNGSRAPRWALRVLNVAMHTLILWALLLLLHPVLHSINPRGVLATAPVQASIELALAWEFSALAFEIYRKRRGEGTGRLGKVCSLAAFIFAAGVPVLSAAAAGAFMLDAISPGVFLTGVGGLMGKMKSAIDGHPSNSGPNKVLTPVMGEQFLCSVELAGIDGD